MEIVIKIPDDFYERVNKDGCMSYTDAEVVVNAFYCGKVLPKGHGRLKDADAFIRAECSQCDGYCDVCDCDCLNCKSEYRCEFIKDVDSTDVVIDADKEEKE